MRKEMEDTKILYQYKGDIQKHVQDKDYNSALRKVNNLLSNNNEVELIGLKVDLLCK